MGFHSNTPRVAQAVQWTIAGSAVLAWVLMWLASPELCNPAGLPQDAFAPQCPWQGSHQWVRVDLWTARELLSLLTLMGVRIRGWQEKSQRDDATNCPHTYLTMHSRRATSPSSTSHFMLHEVKDLHRVLHAPRTQGRLSPELAVVNTSS